MGPRDKPGVLNEDRIDAVELLVSKLNYKRIYPSYKEVWERITIGPEKLFDADVMSLKTFRRNMRRSLQSRRANLPLRIRSRRTQGVVLQDHGQAPRILQASAAGDHEQT